MARVSKRFVRVTTGVAGAGGAVLFGSFGWIVHQDLRDARRTIDALRAESREQRQSLATLEERLGRVGRELLDVRELEGEARARLLRELEARDRGESAVVREELERLEERVRALRAAAEEHTRLLAASRAGEDTEQRYRVLMAPTVRVNARAEVGSGTLLWSRSTGDRARSYVLTAWHIVQEEPALQGGPATLEVDVFADGALLRTERARVAARDARLDLALLEVEGRHVYDRLARLPTRAEVAGVRVFSPVHAIGCPLGYPPLPTSGELTTRDKTLDGNHYWMINAPTIFGNSGGGIYLARDQALIGVLSRISAYKNMIDVAVPHMGLVTPIDRVYDWLEATDYAFVYRDRLAARPAEAAADLAPVRTATTTVPASAPGE